MTRPDDGATAPDTGASEPGHRARAYAAALLGELTGSRRPGTRDLQDPASVPDLAASTLVQRPVDRAGEPDPVPLAGDQAPQAEEPLVGDTAALDDASAGLAGGSPAVDASPADGSSADADLDTAATAGATTAGPAATSDTAGTVGTSTTADPAATSAFADASATGYPATSAPAATSTGTAAAGSGATDDTATGTEATPGTGASATGGGTSTAAGVDDSAGTATGPDPSSAAGGSTTGATPGAATNQGATTSPGAEAPAVTTRTEPTSALVGTPVRTDAVLDRTSAAATPARGPRPSPFTYVEVAAHHTGPARSRAGAVLDGVGAQFSSRADRDQVRRAARTAVEATALLDACDALDARAAAVDATWNGERHGATEVREFEGAWGAFYDTSGALSATA